MFEIFAPSPVAAQSCQHPFHRPAPWQFGSSAALTLAYGLVLAASLLAFGVEVSLVEVLAVYLGGTALASASPTPGNLGAVEVALAAGLTTVGWRRHRRWRPSCSIGCSPSGCRCCPA